MSNIFVPKGWGFEDIIVNNDQYCGKMLFFKKGKFCSIHYHIVKKESFHVHSGKVKMIYSLPEKLNHILTLHKDILQEHVDNPGLFSCFKSIILEAGDSFEVPQGMCHRVIALEDSQVYEFSTHSEDLDSIRLIKGS